MSPEEHVFATRDDTHLPSGRPIMQLSGISKSFGETVVLKSMDLQVSSGEVLILLGENGAGKSTLKNIMCGLLKSDGGDIEFSGVVESDWNVRRAKEVGLAAIHQELSLFPNMSIAENVYINSLGQGPLGTVPRRRLEEETNKLFLDLLEEDIDSSRLVSDLPLGQRQLVEIVKAIRSASSVLVLDEPTTSLSIQERQQLFRVMRRLRGKGYALVHVTHFLEEIAEVGDKVAVMRDGEMVAFRGADEFTIPEIEQLMVGRELASVERPTNREEASPDVVLEVTDLSDTALLHDISFSLHAGEILGIAGLSGAGRTELMQALVGLRPSAGSVVLLGERFTRRSVAESMKRGLVLVSEDRRAEQAYLERTVAENIFAPSLRSVSTAWGWMLRRRERKAAQKLITDFGIKVASTESEFMSMSGGNQQKAILARWLSLDPKVCLLDEPTKGIDVGAKADVQRAIFALASRRVGIVVVSSDLPELFQVADRILVMRAGTLSAELQRDDFEATSVLRAASSEVAHHA